MSQTIIEPEIQGPGIGSGRWMVVIFNDDYTPIDIVIMALMRATGCGRQEAEMETWEAEQYGKTPVHFASRDECTQAAAVISSVGVKTEVCPEWND